MRKIFPYVPLSGDPDGITFGTFDTETEGLGGELLCVTTFTTEDGARIFTGPEMVTEFLDYVEQSGYTIWYAHNLSYDLRRLLSPLISRYGNTVDLVWRTSAEVCAVSYGEQYEWRDSYAIWPHSLRELTKHFCPPELRKLEIDDITRFDPTNAEHVAYALRDSESLHVGLTNFFAALAEHFRVDPGLTVASTAIRAWRHTINRKYYPPSDMEDQELRRYYYGALTGLTSVERVEGAETFDINSSYPAVMESTSMPLRWEWEDAAPARYWSRYLDSSVEGFIDCTVRTPDDLLVPILPTRDAHGAMTWRRGTLRVSVTLAELRFALEHGYELVDIVRVCRFTSTAVVFREFVDLCRSLRYAHKGSAIEQVAKLLQNSLYGKFGARRERYVTVFVEDEFRESRELFPTVIDGLYLETVADQLQAMPQWAAWITANARLRLLDAIYRIGPERVLYYDTDSITTWPGAFPSDLADEREYGKWKLEKRWRWFRPCAPKVYFGELIDDSRVARVKGVPSSKVPDIFDDLKAGHRPKVQYESLSSLHTLLKNGSYESEIVSRSVSDLANSTNWVVDCDGRVRPRWASFRAE